ncbi:MAG: phospholipase D family protein [bacterium]|nr:phospholipase D family protein [bacterium]
MKRIATLVCLVQLLLLAACASLPTGFEQVPSRTWHDPDSTQLGSFFAEFAPDDPELSGVRLVSDPREAFRSRFGFAALAEKTLDLQYYLWKDDLTGQLLLHRALEAADRGVRVRILIDDIFHSGRDDLYAAIDAHPRVEVRLFNPMGTRGLGRNLNFVFHKSTLNYRMHNKIFLADNAVAIVGGRNIGDDYFGIDPKLNFRDLDVLAVGPAARQAGVAYDLYWNSEVAVPIAALLKKPVGEVELKQLRECLEASLAKLEGLPYTVPRNPDDTRVALANLASDMVWAEAEVIVDPLARFDGDTESEFVRWGRGLDESVEHEIVAQTAYLIPAKEGIEQMAELTERGVRVRILTNSLMSNNHLTVHAHYMKYRKRLIRAGVELHELRADAAMLEHFKEIENLIADSHAGLHTKAFVIDKKLSLIGSYNMDPRSRIWNSEIGLLVKSEEFASRVMAEMEEDFDPSNSFRVTLDENDKLRWTGSGEDGPQERTREPGAGLWKRFGARLFSWIPIEKEL